MRPVVEGDTGRCVLLRVGLKGGNSIAEVADVLTIAVRQHTHLALLAAEGVVVFQFDLVAVVL